jgi:hypothetical protein
MKAALCPVCGYDNGGFGLEAHEICLSCGLHYAYESRYAQLRDEWIAGGKKWWAAPSRKPPEDWNPDRQLARLLDPGPERLYLTTNLARAADAIRLLDDLPLAERLQAAYTDWLSRLEPSNFPDDEGRALFESVIADLNRHGLGPMSSDTAEELAKRVERLAALYGEG